ncbi:MAG: DUF1440 domain-containing protein [Anaerolineae bacterium]|nr:DUF1440 domain-containing protein [Anaerolineae bacterium]
MTDPFVEDVTIGAIAGLTATMPMSTAMEWMRRHLPWHERYELPPLEIERRVVEEKMLDRHLPDPAHNILATISHYGYGTTSGVMYALLAARLPGSPLVKGAVFGALVWTSSYMGWLPAFKILPPATDQPFRRNVVMFVANVLWGMVAGVLIDMVRRPSQRA